MADEKVGAGLGADADDAVKEIEKAEKAAKEVVDVPVKVANPCRIVHYDPAQDELADQSTRRGLN